MNFALRLSLPVAALLGSGTLCAATLNVPGQYAGIQQAINAASSGDTVMVSAGVYQGNISLKSGVTVQGCGPDACTIQGDGTGAVVVANQLAATATIDGFKIQGGSGFVVSWSENRIMGGGIFADGSAVNIGHNRIVGNRAQIGGGIAVMNSTVSIIGNTIENNQANSANPASFNMGGGIYLYDSTAEVSDNRIIGNLVDSGTDNPLLVDPNGSLAPGGGIAVVYSKLVGDVSILGNTIADNVAAGSQNYGGGIYLYQPSPDLGNQVYLLGNDLAGNRGLDGGALAIVQMSPLVVGNRFSGNSGHWGGGLYGFSGAGVVAHNRFDGNQSKLIRAGSLTGGGGLLLDEGFIPLVAHNVFDGNSARDYGGGLEVFDSGSSNAVVWKNRFQRNSARFGGGLVASSAAPEIYNNWFSNNSATEKSGGALFAEKTSGLDLLNNVFAGNNAAVFGGGVALVNVSDARVHNNTLDGNHAGSSWWGGGLYANGGSFTLENNIISENGKYGVGIDDGTSLVSRAYNDFFQNDSGACYRCPAGIGELTSSPGYADTVTYLLAPASANVDTGNPAAASNDRDGSRNDIGAYGGPSAGSLPAPGASPAAASRFDSNSSVLSLPQVDLGIFDARVEADLEWVSCAEAPSLFLFRLASFQSVPSQPASQGAFYWDPYVITPSVEVLGDNYDVVFSLYSCESDPENLYLKLEAVSVSL
jgi:predicted outer membrane repeat protein